ncbi:MAG: SagB/ThcOx family dehydrogenase [Candidatus Methanoperedens sp.]|nr:SagB/ThcOx family dehydrogenase [Candidatus Methanoperedens sp.]
MNSIGREFIERTKYQYLEKSDQSNHLPQPGLEAEYDASRPIIDLPGHEDIKIKSFDLRKAIESRRSIRNYSHEQLSIEELSYLLWVTQGVVHVTSSATFRNVPSAGARHALETYLLINNVEGVPNGLYRFLAIDHKLVEINTDPDIASRVMEGCLDQDFVRKSAVTFIWTADAYRMKWRYGERGYRYLHLDAGHVCQNLYLGAGSVDCGVCAIAAFSDDYMNELLGFDGVEQFVIYVATVGKINY